MVVHTHGAAIPKTQLTICLTPMKATTFVTVARNTLTRVALEWYYSAAAQE
jgi:hypothetical protein